MPRTAIPSHQATSLPSGQRGRLSVDPDALFVYGTLLFPEVLHALLDRVPNQAPVSAPGWRVVALPGRVYPGLVPDKDTATGLLLTDLGAHEWRILDTFEDDQCELRHLSLSDGRAGWAYVCRDETPPSRDDWDAKLFNDRDLAAYVQACITWRRRYPGS
jgi:gamma-glutamylcyclotransferase (GGCT)/AIG2-like uncharacterized protein YtfP